MINRIKIQLFWCKFYSFWGFDVAKLVAEANWASLVVESEWLHSFTKELLDLFCFATIPQVFFSPSPSYKLYFVI